MKVNDYIDCLRKEIDWFECTHNKSPRMIIMSAALANHIAKDLVMYSQEGYVYPESLDGLPLMVYPSHELECHLVEHTFGFY